MRIRNGSFDLWATWVTMGTFHLEYSFWRMVKTLSRVDVFILLYYDQLFMNRKTWFSI